mgnify:CR=1 FL=1
MKFLQSYVFRAMCAIVMGLLLIRFPDNTMVGITIAIGVLFLIAGVGSIVSYVVARRSATDVAVFDAQGRQIAGQKPMFPIVGIGSVLLGLILALMPKVFISWLMYILGAVVVMAACAQLVSFFSARRIPTVAWAFALCPVVLLLAGLFVVLYPLQTAEMPLLILGWCLLLYGVTEYVNETKYYLNRRRARKEAEQAAVEEVATGADTQLVAE